MVRSRDIFGQNAHSALIETEALAWLAQLDGEDVSARDLEAFREWVSRSPAHAREIQALSAFWDELNGLTDMAGPIAHADRLPRQMRRRDKWLSRRKAALWPAMACCIAIVAFAGMQVNRAPARDAQSQIAAINLPMIFISNIGEQQVHTLSDGSVITLNTNSQVEVDYRPEQRRIRLLQGEALFDVAHDSARPFMVFAGDGMVRAVGTAFTVRLKGDVVDVLVSEGSVELSSVLPPAPSVRATDKPSRPKLASIGIVKAGHAAAFERAQASIETISPEQMGAKMSWQSGFLTFSGESLEEVVSEVSRYTELSITITDPDVKVLRLGGVFKSGDTDVLFDTLEANFGIIAHISADKHVTLSRAP